jgi:cleavage and polyadenylation specificity factor subunit 1
MGGLSTLVPLKAARYKRLQLLQGQLTRSVQHVAGLNPKAYRSVKIHVSESESLVDLCTAHYRHVANRYQARALNKGVLDGFLLQTFIDLPIDKQKELVTPIGTNRETIINDLVDLAFTW